MDNVEKEKMVKIQLHDVNFCFFVIGNYSSISISPRTL